MELDHLAVTADELDGAAAHVEAALGAAMQPGGQHARFGTHNRLLGLESGLYLEAIAVDPGAPPPDDARWFGLDAVQGAPRLAVWICRVDDLDAALAALPGAGRAVALSRGDLRWRMAVPQDGRLPWDGLFPALIEWEGRAHPAERLAPSGCRLAALEVRHPEAAGLHRLLAPHLRDERVRLIADARPALRAHFDTPRGPRVLE